MLHFEQCLCSAYCFSLSLILIYKSAVIARYYWSNFSFIHCSHLVAGKPGEPGPTPSFWVKKYKKNTQGRKAGKANKTKPVPPPPPPQLLSSKVWFHHCVDSIDLSHIFMLATGCESKGTIGWGVENAGKGKCTTKTDHWWIRNVTFASME